MDPSSVWPILDVTGEPLERRRMVVDNDQAITLPLVFMHGMGDSCFNSGMKSITKSAGEHMNVYSVCIPTGNGRVSDTMNGFFMTMNDNVDEFAKRVAADKNLA